MSTKTWWEADRPPRDYAAAILAMGNDKERQRSFFDAHVPEHLQAIVMDHVKTALALQRGGGK